MDRVMGIQDRGALARDERARTERLLHRRAAGERCVRDGLLRRCRPVAPGRRPSGD